MQMCVVAEILAIVKEHNKTEDSHSNRLHRGKQDNRSLYCWSAPSASILIDLINSVETSYGVKSA